MAGRTSKSQESYYSLYKTNTRWKTNRERKLLKLMQQQPNNKNIPAALDNLHYRRKNPKSRMWSKTAKRTAQLIKKFTGSCPHAIFSSNAKLAESTLLALRMRFNPQNLPQGYVSFTLGDRVVTRTFN